jgi:hypothetical protein
MDNKFIKRYSDFTLNESYGSVFGPEATRKALLEKLEQAKKNAEKYGEKNPSYLSTVERVQNVIDGNETLDWKKPLHIPNPDKVEEYEIFKGRNSDALAERLGEIIDKYKQYEVKDSSIASAPNSASFRASVGGFIRGAVNLRSPGGYYGTDRNYLLCLQIGGGIPSEIKNQIKQEVYEACFIFDQYNQSNGGVDFDQKSGTNYDTIGLTCSEYSFNKTAEDRLNSIMNK